MTRAELFAGHGGEERRVRVLLGAMTELPVDTAIAERAGRIRRTTGTRLADSIIAATAFERGLTLVTRNVSDTSAIRGLKLAAPP